MGQIRLFNPFHEGKDKYFTPKKKKKEKHSIRTKGALVPIGHVISSPLLPKSSSSSFSFYFLFLFSLFLPVLANSHRFIMFQPQEDHMRCGRVAQASKPPRPLSWPMTRKDDDCSWRVVVRACELLRHFPTNSNGFSG